MIDGSVIGQVVLANRNKVGHFDIFDVREAVDMDETDSVPPMFKTAPRKKQVLISDIYGDYRWVNAPIRNIVLFE